MKKLLFILLIACSMVSNNCAGQVCSSVDPHYRTCLPFFRDLMYNTIDSIYAMNCILRGTMPWWATGSNPNPTYGFAGGSNSQICSPYDPHYRPCNPYWDDLNKALNDSIAITNQLLRNGGSLVSITGSGTINTIPKFTSATKINNSTISDNGLQTIVGDTLVVNGNDTVKGQAYFNNTVYIPFINNFATLPAGDTVLLSQTNGPGQMITVPIRTAIAPYITPFDTTKNYTLSGIIKFTAPDTFYTNVTIDSSVYFPNYNNIGGVPYTSNVQGKMSFTGAGSLSQVFGTTSGTTIPSYFYMDTTYWHNLFSTYVNDVVTIPNIYGASNIYRHGNGLGLDSSQPINLVVKKDTALSLSTPTKNTFYFVDSFGNIITIGSITAPAFSIFKNGIRVGGAGGTNELDFSNALVQINRTQNGPNDLNVNGYDSVNIGTYNGVYHLNASFSNSGNFRLRNNAYISGSGTFGTTNNINATSTNNNAIAGNIGEYTEQVQGSWSALTTGVLRNDLALTLTAGDWDIIGYALISNQSGAGNLSITDANLIISTSAGSNIYLSNYTSGLQEGYIGTLTAHTNNPVQVVVPKHKLKLSGTTTIYLNITCDFTGSAYYAPFFSASRPR